MKNTQNKDKMKIKTKEEYYKNKELEFENPILCPKCKIEMEFDSNEVVENEHPGFFRWLFGMTAEATDNAWFECPLCEEEYFIENYEGKSQ